ncbi:hypothetical protein QJQ45_026467 [Haematococcus lacustris]|nr:hypothetical protein QJQ45_026467 [Haematococcus lacustris]
MHGLPVDAAVSCSAPACVAPISTGFEGGSNSSDCLRSSSTLPSRGWHHGLAEGAVHHSLDQAAWCVRESLDHFSRVQEVAAKTWKQRYVVCTDFWNPSDGPIFFYAGNEADVMLYVNATGLMWENALHFGALLVFAEVCPHIDGTFVGNPHTTGHFTHVGSHAHRPGAAQGGETAALPLLPCHVCVLLTWSQHRYYGASQPFGPDSWRQQPGYLTSQQAMADFAHLMHALRNGLLPGAQDSPIIVFGGSYGGELAAWLRMKYPHLVAGAIAASAPIGAFPGVPGFEPATFWKVVTYGASEAAGAAAGCVPAVRAVFRHLMELPHSQKSLDQVQRRLRLCQPLGSALDLQTVAYWLQGAWDAFAMGNYPYASSYISGDPDHPPARLAHASRLPAHDPGLSLDSGGQAARPGVRASDQGKDCTYLNTASSTAPGDLLSAMADAVGLMYNATGREQCFTLDTTGPAGGNVGPWDFQFCTEQMAQEQPYFPANGRTDMFWDQGAFDWPGIVAHCHAAWGLEPDPTWAVEQLGGLALAHHASNIVFSNGLLDPWSAFGVLDSASDSVVATLIPEGAHHLDLMWTHPEDPDSVRATRQLELQHIQGWVTQHKQALRQRLSPRWNNSGHGRDRHGR